MIFLLISLALFRNHSYIYCSKKIEMNIKLFESKQVRTHWDAEKEKWYFSVIDVIEILSESPRPRKMLECSKN